MLGETVIAGSAFISPSSTSGANSFLSARAVQREPREGAVGLFPHADRATAAESSGSGSKVASATVSAVVSMTAFAARASRQQRTKSAKLCGGSATSSCASSKAVVPRASVIRNAMFERFTEQSMKAVMMAQSEARKLDHDHVGTEMLVVGIIAEGTDSGAMALAHNGIGVEDARRVLEALIGRGTGGKAIEVPFTEAAQEALEFAIDCARAQGSGAIGTGHMLEAVLRRKKEKGAQLVQQLLAVSNEVTALERLLPLLNTNVKPGSASTPIKSEPELELTETLKYAQDLTQMAREGKIDPMVGREKEFERTVRILGRRSKNNPVLVGEAGVGKTSIAHGIAQRIVEGRVPQTLRNKIVLQLDLAMLLAGTRYRGDFEERLKAVVDEVQAAGRRVVLVIDEIHTLVGAGAGGGGEGGGIDAANLLKPALARGELQCIGATTMDEYRKYIEKDPALERRFQPVHVCEPTEEDAVEILTALAPRYEKHHELKYTPEALKLAVKLASQYISDRFLPDKAIDVMDEAGSKVRQEIYKSMETEATVQEQQAINLELDDVREKKKAAVAAERYGDAKDLKEREVGLLKRLETLTKPGAATGPQAMFEELQAIRKQLQEEVSAERFGEAYELKVREGKILEQLERATGSIEKVVASMDPKVTEQDVAEVVSGWTGIAVEEVSADESARLLRLEDILHERLIGQDEAVRAVSLSLRRARAGLRDSSRPIAGFMFSGPTGVGKTELCKALASTYFGSIDSMVRFDMSEFMEKHTVSKLIGSPPGYVGYDEGGALTEAVRRRPYSLVLFDEVEKAHPDVFNLMLQLLDDGRLTDSKGRTVSFANALIVMTTNLGSRSVEKGVTGGGGIGFGTADDQDDANYDKVKEMVLEEMKNFFRPEFLNRLDEIVVFRPLTKDDVRAIAELEFAKVSKRLEEQNLHMTLTDTYKELVVNEGFDPAYGARPLRRAITRLLEDKLAEFLLADGANARSAAGAEHRVLMDVNSSGEVFLKAMTGSEGVESDDEGSVNSKLLVSS